MHWGVKENETWTDQLFECWVILNTFFDFWFFLKLFFQKILSAIPSCIKQCGSRSGPEVIKLFPCSTQLSTKFILFINVKMPTIVGILTFISRINTTSERLRWKGRNVFIFQHFSFQEQLKFRAQLSWVWFKLYNLGARPGKLLDLIWIQAGHKQAKG